MKKRLKDEEWRYIHFHICQSIRAGTAIPQHWAILNKYDLNLAEAMRKEVMQRLVGIKKPKDGGIK